MEEVLDHKIERAYHVYRSEVKILVKWKGYEDPTWENFTQFAQDSPELIKRYFISLDQKIQNLEQNHITTKPQIALMSVSRKSDSKSKIYSECELQAALKKQREDILNSSEWRFVLMQVGLPPAED